MEFGALGLRGAVSRTLTVHLVTFQLCTTRDISTLLHNQLLPVPQACVRTRIVAKSLRSRRRADRPRCKDSAKQAARMVRQEARDPEMRFVGLKLVVHRPVD